MPTPATTNQDRADHSRLHDHVDMLCCASDYELPKIIPTDEPTTRPLYPMWKTELQKIFSEIFCTTLESMSVGGVGFGLAKTDIGGARYAIWRK